MKIIKRDGSSEDWSDDKLATALVRSGVPSEEVDNLVNVIKGNIKSENTTSDNIKTLVINELKKSYPQAADMYENYKK